MIPDGEGREVRSAVWLRASAKPSGEVVAMLVAAVLYVLYFGYIRVGLEFAMLRADVGAYWMRSLTLSRAVFDPWWPPGYPLMIAIVRAVTLDALPALIVMELISGVAYVISVGAACRVARELRLDYALGVALVFAVSPFVGLTYAVYPIADSSAIALCTLSVLAFERRTWAPFAAYAATAMIVHKATWFVLPLLMVVAFVKYRESRSLLPVSVVPVTVWILCGAWYHSDLWWFVRSNITNSVVSGSPLPIFDGMVGSLLFGGPAKMAKGAVVVGTFALALLVAYRCWRLRFWSGLSISLAVILMVVFMNQVQVWVVVRFSKLLIIPLAFIVLTTENRVRRLLEGRVMVAAAAWVGCILTNLAFGYYHATVEVSSRLVD